MNTTKRHGQTIHHDNDGEEYVIDEDGNHQVPMHSERISDDDEFTTYDDSKGYCSFCDKLTCNGGCFK